MSDNHEAFISGCYSFQLLQIIQRRRVVKVSETRFYETTSRSFSLIYLNAKTLQTSHQYFVRSPFTQHCENPVLPCQCSDTHSSFLSLPVVCTIQVSKAFNHILDHMFSLYTCEHCFSAHLLCEAASTEYCLLSFPLFVYPCPYFYVSMMWQSDRWELQSLLWAIVYCSAWPVNKEICGTSALVGEHISVNISCLLRKLW